MHYKPNLYQIFSAASEWSIAVQSKVQTSLLIFIGDKTARMLRTAGFVLQGYRHRECVLQAKQKKKKEKKRKSRRNKTSKEYGFSYEVVGEA